MKLAWVGCLLAGSLVFAGTEDPEFNVNSRYTVESVVVSGNGWSTNLTAEQNDHRISSGLRREIVAIVGLKLNPAALDDLAGKLRREFQARAVTHRVLRGASPEYVRVVFEVEVRPTRFDVSVPKLLYSSRQGTSGAIEGTATLHHNGFTLGLVSDADELAERYTGFVARYEDTSLGTDRVHFRFQFASYHEQWNSVIRDHADASQLYRTRQDVAPAVTIVLFRPLTLTVGTSFESLEEQTGQVEAANAFVTGLRYHRRMDDSDYQQDVDADYNLRASSRFLGSDFLYGRHRWTFRYALIHGKHTLSDDFTAGIITGRAPLFERFVLGNSTTLRGWNKYDIDPLGGNRVVHNSVEYRYGWFQVFYDSGAVWDGGQGAPVRHSLGVGVHQGPLFVAVAFPLRDGRLDPIFMVGMTY